MKICVTVALVLTGTALLAQFDHHYKPLGTYDNKSIDLIAGLRKQMYDELDGMERSDRRKVEQFYKARSNYLVQSVKKKLFVNDDSLQALIGRLVDALVENNRLTKKPTRVLILRSSFPNAISYGEGTIAVTIGLLSRLRNESELAFVLAHELAHYELDHIKSRTLQFVESGYASKMKVGLGKLLSHDDEVTKEEIDALKRLVYDGTRFSRAHEVEADSLGFALFSKAGFDVEQSMLAMNILDSALIMKRQVGPAMFEPLDSRAYPFQPYWLRNKLSIYSKKQSVILIWETDSLESHPDIEYRKERIARYLGRSQDYHPTLPEGAINYMAQLSEFELVESAYANLLADYTLCHALLLLNIYPENSYLIMAIGRLLTRVCEVKKGNVDPGDIHIPVYNQNYDEQLQLVNNFLYNATHKEIGEVAYQFLSNEKNFDPESEEHYYLLWKICTLTSRRDQAKKLRGDYKEKFPEGKFWRVMKESVALSEAMKD